MKISANDPRFNLVHVPEADWGESARKASVKPLRVWKSTAFQVNLWLEKGGVFRLSINRTARSTSKRYNFREGIAWDELQRLKAAAGFGTWQAVEFYPPDEQVVYQDNVRHLWLMREPLKFQWKIAV